MASQITGGSIVYSTVGSGVDQRKKTSKLRVIGICEGNSPVTGEFPAQKPATRKMFLFDDVIMYNENRCCDAFPYKHPLHNGPEMSWHWTGAG